MDDKTIFYIVGSALTVLALIISLIGVRSKQFPPAGPLGRLMLAGFAALVLVTAAYAVLSAREEQSERREHLAEAFEQASEEPTVEEAVGEEPAEEEQAAEEQEATKEAEGEGGDELETQGAQVFADNGCGGCHTLAAAGTTGAIGPDLDENLAGKDDAYIEESIVDPDAEVAEGFNAGTMPQSYESEIAEDDLAALVAYLKFAISQK